MTHVTTTQRLSTTIAKKIPLSKAMGLKVKSASVDRGVHFILPLRPNRNHKNTAFGGTLVAAQALACWAWLTLLLDQMAVSGEVVVQKQSGDFLRPVKAEFSVHTDVVSQEKTDRFLLTLNKKGKARIRLAAQVSCQGKVCATYIGDYVAIKL